MTRALVPVIGAPNSALGVSHWNTSNGEYGSFYRKRRAREVFRQDVDEPSVTVDEEPYVQEMVMAAPPAQVAVDGVYQQENEVLRQELERCKMELERLRRTVEEVLGAKEVAGVAVPRVASPSVSRAVPVATRAVPALPGAVPGVPRAIPAIDPGREDAAVQTPESVAAALAEAERAAGRAAGLSAVKVNPPFRTGVYRPPTALREPAANPAAHTPLWRIPRDRVPEHERPVTVVPTRPYRPGTGNIGAYKNPPYGRNGAGPIWGDR